MAARDSVIALVDPPAGDAPEVCRARKVAPLVAAMLELFPDGPLADDRATLVPELVVVADDWAVLIAELVAVAEAKLKTFPPFELPVALTVASPPRPTIIGNWETPASPPRAEASTVTLLNPAALPVAASVAFPPFAIEALVPPFPPRPPIAE